MRGRLIRPFLAELAQVDHDSTAFDPIFREPVSERAEKPLIQLKAQIEPKQWAQLDEMLSGNNPDYQVRLQFHLKDLERADLVDTDTGDVLIRPNDRLNAIYDLRGNLVQLVPNPPGLYVQHAKPTSYGLGVSRNLVTVLFMERMVSKAG